MDPQMEKTNPPTRHHRRPILGYEIRVGEHLDANALDWFGEVAITNHRNGDALLTSSIPDQAALLRVLLHLNDLGLTILEVKSIKRKRV
jgi:hypothetical protein